MPGDIDGVDVCADYNTEIDGVLIAVDITLDAVDYAKLHGFNCILSHHAMIYTPLNKLDANSGICAKKAAMLAKADICAASFHTRLDGVKGGVNDCLMAVLGIKKTDVLFDGNNLPMGRICQLEHEISVEKFAADTDAALKKFFKDTFDFEIKGCVKFTQGADKIKKLAAVAGGGMSFIDYAALAGADTFLTGEAKFYDILAARENYGINVITAGHFETEATVLPEIKAAVSAEFPEMRTAYFIGGYGGLI